MKISEIINESVGGLGLYERAIHSSFRNIITEFEKLSTYNSLGFRNENPEEWEQLCEYMLEDIYLFEKSVASYHQYYVETNMKDKGVYRSFQEQLNSITTRVQEIKSILS